MRLGAGAPVAEHSSRSEEPGRTTCRRLSKNAFVCTNGRESGGERREMISLSCVVHMLVRLIEEPYKYLDLAELLPKIESNIFSAQLVT